MTIGMRGTLRCVTTDTSVRSCSSGSPANSGTDFHTVLEIAVEVILPRGLLKAEQFCGIVGEYPAPYLRAGRPIAEQIIERHRAHLVGEGQVRVVAAPEDAPGRRGDER